MIKTIIMPALLGGIGLSISLGGLGVFIVWQRLSFLGDVLAHSSLLGIALSIIMNCNPLWGIILVAFLLGLTLSHTLTHHYWSQETLLALLCYGGLAFSLLIISMLPSGTKILTKYLFGDILAITPIELLLIWSMAIIVIIFLIYKWQELLSITITPEISLVEGINVKKLRIIFITLTSLIIALSLKFVGALLVVALLVIPAATATSTFRTPFFILLGSIIIGQSSILISLLISFFCDIPIAPLVASIIFTILILIKLFKFTKRFYS